MTILDWAGVTAIIAAIVPVLTWLFVTAKTMGRIDERTATQVKQVEDQIRQSHVCRRDVWARLDNHGERITIVEERIKPREP